MKPRLSHSVGIAFALLAGPLLHAQEPASDIAGLELAAAEYVVAYNERDSAALAAHFHENGEIINIDGTEVISGRADIQARYDEIFADPDVPSVALEVDAVRLIDPNLAIEEGTVHYTPPGNDAPARSITYTAVLQKNEDGNWLVASSRTLDDVTGPSGKLADIINDLKGDWTSEKNGVRIDLAIDWDESGSYVSCELLVSRADAKPQTTAMRIGWDPVRETIVSWTFDSLGGFAKADWTPTETGWLIHTAGTTADGESRKAGQKIIFTGDDTFTWSAGHRVIGGESLPNIEFLVVRQAPEPKAE